jgi:uncharacterized protein (DUF305 family)
MRRLMMMLTVGMILAGILSACGQGPAAAPATQSPMADMDHGAMASGVPVDAQFIDSMIVHHEGAIDMGEQALRESERPEIRELANEIISAQESEVEQMRAWRDAWYPDLAASAGMEMPMGDMEISGDSSQPFDLRFIDAMIAHHRGAIDMAQHAQAESERDEIRQLAEAIITAQEAEITQLEQWRVEWFGR